VKNGYYYYEAADEAELPENGGSAASEECENLNAALEDVTQPTSGDDWMLRLGIGQQIQVVVSGSGM
jgi:hypothetical protein